MLKPIELKERKTLFVFFLKLLLIQQIKIQRLLRYFCHIYGDMKHKIIDCLKYSDMHNMFKNKGMKIVEKPFVVEPKVINSLVHMVDVNMAITNSKVIK